ncbi:MAG: hypothetical protein KDK27_06160 [Leptospiraceae bacterium]|nr:hypothetical protein [Leptospiraceae bacterium]
MCKRIFLYITIALVIPVQSCTLFRARDLSDYPVEWRSLFLHNFTNETFEPDVNVEMTEWVRREFLRRDNFDVESDKDEARLWVYGEITAYRKEGRMFDDFRTPTRVDLFIAVRFKLRQNPERMDPSISDTLLLSREIGTSVQYSGTEGYTESEFQARQRLLQILALRLNDAIENEFVNRFPEAPKSSTEQN